MPVTRSVVFAMSLAAATAMSFVIVPGRPAVPFAPAFGLLFVALLATEWRHWPLLLAAALTGMGSATFALSNAPWPATAGFLAGDLLGALIGAAVLHLTLGWRERLETTRDVLLVLVVGTSIASATAATIGLGVVAGFGDGADWEAWPVLGAGRVAGALAVAGLVLAANDLVAAVRTIPRTSWVRRAEAATVFLVLPILGMSVGGFFGAVAIVPMLIWASLRFGLAGTASAVLVVGVATAANTASGRGILLGVEGDARIAMGLTFFSVLAVASWVLAITLRQQRESGRTVEASEARYRSLVEMSPDLICIVRDGRFVYVNVALYQAVGADSAAEMVGRSLADYLHPDDLTASAGRLQEVIKLGTIAPPRRFRVRRVSGEWFHVESRASAIEFGGRSAVQVVARDVTEQLRLETEIRTSEERYRSLVDLSPDAILIVQDGRVVYANRAAMDIAGMPVGPDSLGTPLKDFLRPEDWADHAARMRTILETGKAVPPRNYRAIRRDGQPIDIEARGGPCQYDGRPAVQVVVRDVTERVHAEEARVRSEERLRTLIESEPECVKVVARDGTIREMNAAGLRMLGADAANQVIGQCVFDVMAPEYRDAYRAFHDRICQGIGGTLEFQVIDFRGGRRSFSTHGVPFRGPDGELVHLAVTRDETKRKQDEAALRESELRLRQLAEASDQVFWLTTAAPAPDVLYVSPAFEAIWGRPAADLYRDARIWSRSIHPIDAARVQDEFVAWVRHERPEYDSQYRIIDTAGRVHWIHDTGAYIRNATGEVYRLSGIARDITAQVEARARRERYQAALVSLWTAQVFRPGRLAQCLTAITEAAAEAMGVARVGVWLLTEDRAALQAADLFEHAHARHSNGTALAAADYPRYFQAFAENRIIAAHDAQLDPQTSEFTPGYLAPLGITSMLDAPVRTDDGLVGVICHEHVGPARQWTDEDQAFAASLGDLIGMALETDRRYRAEQSLRDSEAFLQMAQRLGRIGSFDWDIATGRVRWSDEMCRLHGLAPGEFDGRIETAATFVHPGDADAMTRRLGQVVDSGSFEPSEYRVRAKDGVERWLWATGEVVRGEFGQAVRCIGTVIDITERKAAEQALRDERASLARRVEERTQELSRANAELANANRLKDEFLANMSHELRTPLTSILGLTEVLLAGIHGPVIGKQAEALSVIEASGRHLLDLINDILDLAKIGAGKLQLSVRPVRVEAVCRAALDMVKPTATAKRLRVTFRRDPAAALVSADELRLKQVLVNLLSNATKFTPADGEIGLEVTADAAAEVLRFAVWDHGIGIAADQLPRLFRPFVQAEGGLARRHEGTGLGLVLVQRMVALHHGSVKVDSEPGQGSRFTITIPWTAPSLEAEAVAPTPLSAVTRRAAPATPGLKPRVLVAEDTAPVASLISTVLGQAGYAVTLAVDGAEAVRLAREVGPNLILTDIHLPNLSGLDVIREVRGMADLQQVPIVVLTGQAGAADRAECLAAGADDYLEKPFRVADLVRVAEKHCPSGGSKAAPPSPEPADRPLILVAEDNEAAVSLLSDALMAGGFRVTATRTGADALKAAEAERPALIVSDIHMPGMDGLELIRRLRAIPRLAGVPIFAVTALAMPGDRERCLAAGADEYMSKPYRVAALLKSIRTRLRKGGSVPAAG